MGKNKQSWFPLSRRLCLSSLASSSSLFSSHIFTNAKLMAVMLSPHEELLNAKPMLLQEKAQICVRESWMLQGST